MTNDSLDDLILTEVPLIATMATILAMMCNQERREAIPREPYMVRNIHRSAHMARIMDGGVHNCVEYLRMTKDTFLRLCTILMNLSGVGWNDSEKMLVLEDETYRTYVEGQPKAKEYLNKPIPLFEELRLVAGDDHATGDHARSIYDKFGGTIPEDDIIPPTNESMDCGVFEANSERHETPRTSASNTASIRTCRTSKNTYGNPMMEKFGNKMGDLAGAIDRSRKRTWKEKFSDALWDMEGYDDDDMDMVFNKLINDKKQAEMFYLRKPSLRKRWLDDFIAQMKNSSP